MSDSDSAEHSPDRKDSPDTCEHCGWNRSDCHHWNRTMHKGMCEHTERSALLTPRTWLSRWASKGPSPPPTPTKWNCRWPPRHSPQLALNYEQKIVYRVVFPEHERNVHSSWNEPYLQEAFNPNVTYDDDGKEPYILRTSPDLGTNNDS